MTPIKTKNNRDPKTDDKIIAFDIETYSDAAEGGLSVPYAVALRHGGEGSY